VPSQQGTNDILSQLYLQEAPLMSKTTAQQAVLTTINKYTVAALSK
jgi:hypothetical protein